MEAGNGKQLEAENGNGKHLDAENGKIERADSKLIIINLFLRIFSFALSLAAVAIMVSSKQTKLVKPPTLPVAVPLTSKYTDSPALIYFVVALSLSISYTFITSFTTFWVLKKRFSSKSLLKYYLVLIVNDVVMIGLVGAAAGAGGCIGYLGLKGNSKVGWNKICNVYGKFCKQLSIAFGLSIGVGVVLIILVSLSAFSVHRLARKTLN
ncbi:hypothetical protein NE237_027580 [Protea cynaroides]|uniref:CASP-like protein n=1 Tax=Protea cynaroides TaxID=273540 RepID=A0A9Q0JUI6_9MAGN|nr:hypothetical protein NE237_027580 [Protea cynaroides]